jgi:ABC-2 type transport system permease protein
MTGAIRSELRKILTTRNPRSLLLVGSGVIALLTWASIHGSDTASLPLDQQIFLRLVVPQVMFTLVLVLGIRGFTDEFRHGSIVPTLLATPERRRVIAAKLLAVGAAAVVYAVVAEAVAIGVGSAVMASEGISISAAAGPLARELGLIVVAAVAWSAVGVGIGALVKHQVAAIVGSLVWLLIGESLIGVFLPSVAKYLPGSASDSMIRLAVGDGTALLPALVGAAVFAAWMVGLVTAGAVALERRDIA